MFLIEDDCFTELLGGEFYQVIVAKKLNPDISVYQLFNYQFKYDIQYEVNEIYEEV